MTRLDSVSYCHQDTIETKEIWLFPNQTKYVTNNYYWQNVIVTIFEFLWMLYTDNVNKWLTIIKIISLVVKLITKLSRHYLGYDFIVVKRKLSAIISFYMLVFKRLSVLCKPIRHFTAILFTLLFATTFTVYIVKIRNAQKRNYTSSDNSMWGPSQDNPMWVYISMNQIFVQNSISHFTKFICR